MKTSPSTAKKYAKRVFLITVIAIVLLICAVCVSACKEKVKLNEIKVVYNGGTVEEGGTLNKNDIVVTAKYSNKKIKVVTNYTLKYDFSAEGKRSVTVEYTEQGVTRKDSFEVTVVRSNPPEPVVTLKSITAVYNGENVKVGGTHNHFDFVVTAHYSDGTSKTVNNFAIGSFSSASSGEKEVTVTYTEGEITKTCTVTVTVVDDTPPKPVVTLERITAAYNGENVKVGGTLNNADIAVTAHYSDESSKSVTNFSVGNFSSAAAGTCVITISYTDNGVTKECTVNVTVVENNVVEVANYGKYGILQDNGSVKITNTAIVNDNLQIHFLAFENVTPGDSVFIKAGDTDILIDAGSTTSSSTTIDNYIKKYCTDGVLEYVIATHADNDHISGFVGNGTNGIMDKYRCETIIKYTASNKNTNVRNNFEAKCQQQVNNNNAKLYTALQCWKQTDGAQRVYRVSNNIEMEVLYHKYYENLSSDENNQSVCVIFHQYGDDYDFANPNNPNNKNNVNHFLFTGDLEKEGEASLVEKNPNLPEVVLFKGGHHGSATSSTEALLNMVKPKLVCVCTCCDDETTYKFPRQEFINRVAKYTDMLFLTNTRNGSSTQYVHLNGNIAVTSNSNGVFVNCSNNNLLFKDTDWFKNNRTCPPEWESATTSN